MDIQYRFPALAITLAALAGTSGCAEQAHRYADLSQDADSEESLPETIRDSAFEGSDLESIRWVGEHDGTVLWLGVAEHGRGVCLLLYPDAEGWLSGCSESEEVTVSRGHGWDYHVHPDGTEPPDESIQISSNVSATER